LFTGMSASGQHTGGWRPIIGSCVACAWRDRAGDTPGPGRGRV